jgi:hypothetical protein
MARIKELFSALVFIGLVGTCLWSLVFAQTSNYGVDQTVITTNTVEMGVSMDSFGITGRRAGLWANQANENNARTGFQNYSSVFIGSGQKMAIRRGGLCAEVKVEAGSPGVLVPLGTVQAWTTFVTGLRHLGGGYVTATILNCAGTCGVGDDPSNSTPCPDTILNLPVPAPPLTLIANSTACPTGGFPNKCVFKCSATYPYIDGTGTKCVQCLNNGHCDDSNECTNNVCNAGLCTYPAVVNGTGCSSDGRECTIDQCLAGVCNHTSRAYGIPCTNDGEVCTSDICDGGVNCTHPAVAGPVCRVAADVCDVPEVCNGVSTTCPLPDVFQPNTTLCRAAGANATCDPAEYCTGSAASCPANNYPVNSTPCNNMVGLCGETCTNGVCGGGVACPSCDNDGVCDPGENGSICPADCCDANTPCGQTYGNGPVNCGAEELCPTTRWCRNFGAGYSWVTPATVASYAVSPPCDQTALCTGIAYIDQGPADAYHNGGLWGLSANGCCGNNILEGAEQCDAGFANNGACPKLCSASCANNAPCGACAGKPNTFVCKTAVLPCDVEEKCDGVNPDCPADVFRPGPGITLCRAAGANATCDPAEYCTGSAADCPANNFAVNGTDCDDSNPLTCNDKCNGSGSCNLGGACSSCTGILPPHGRLWSDDYPVVCPAVVDCVGSWGGCVGAVKTYTITTPAQNGGFPCPYNSGDTETVSCCPNDCAAVIAGAGCIPDCGANVPLAIMPVSCDQSDGSVCQHYDFGCILGCGPNLACASWCMGMCGGGEPCTTDCITQNCM